MQKVNKGGALLTALFIMTLVAIVATAMSMRLQLDIYRTRLIVTYDKLYLASQGVTFWAMDELNNKNKRFLKLDEKGFVGLYPKTMENLDKQIKITGGLYDLQARFNLNNAVDPKILLGFGNLIQSVIPQKSKVEANNLAVSLMNWLNPFDPSKPDSNVAYYLKQVPPYYPSNMPMQSRSELRLLKDLNADHYLALEPFLIALPEPNIPVNINTASKQVLMSLGYGLTEDKANEIIMARGDEGIEDFKDIDTLITKNDLPKTQIVLESTYFLSLAEVSQDEFTLRVYTILKRSRDNDNKITVSVIRESFNVF